MEILAESVKSINGKLTGTPRVFAVLTNISPTGVGVLSSKMMRSLSSVSVANHTIVSGLRSPHKGRPSRFIKSVSFVLSNSAT